MLSPAQITEYADKGFLFVENALSSQQLQDLNAVTDRLIEQSAEVTESNALYDLDNGHTPEAPRLTRIKLPHELDPVYWDIIRSERICSLIKPLLGENIRLHTSKLNTKAPDGGSAVEWHRAEVAMAFLPVPH